MLEPHHWIYFARHARKWSCLCASLGGTKLRCHTTTTPGKASLAPVGRERCTSQRAGPLDTSNAAACSRKPMVQDATGGGCVTHHRCCCTRAATSCPFKVAAHCRRWISRWTKRTRMDPGGRRICATNCHGSVHPRKSAWIFQAPTRKRYISKSASVVSRRNTFVRPTGASVCLLTRAQASLSSTAARRLVLCSNSAYHVVKGCSVRR